MTVYPASSRAGSAAILPSATVLRADSFITFVFPMMCLLKICKQLACNETSYSHVLTVFDDTDRAVGGSATPGVTHNSMTCTVVILCQYRTCFGLEVAATTTPDTCNDVTY